MAQMICPLMSGPVFAHYNSDDRGPETLAEPCIGSKCAFWRWSRNAYDEPRKPKGRCGYASGQGGEFFVDPSGQVPSTEAGP